MTGKLLENLLELAELSKTDFAMSLFVSPSTLSNILSGKRLPKLAEKEKFCNQTSGALASALYGHQCHLKLQKVFPVIYEIKSKEELQGFLNQAISYTLDKDFAEEQELNVDFPDYSKTYFGYDSIRNMICVILSDVALKMEPEILDVFSTLRYGSALLRDWAEETVIAPNEDRRRFTINQFIAPGYFDDLPYEVNLLKRKSNFLRYLRHLDRISDLRLWGANINVSEEFLLVNDHFVLLFDLHPEGTLSMTHVTNKGLIHRFYYYVLKNRTSAQSFNRAEVRDYLIQNPGRISEYFADNIVSTYFFTNAGVLFRDDELEDAEPEPLIREAILSLNNAILNGDGNIYLTTYELEDFFSTGEINLPLAKRVTLPAESRLDYIKRSHDYAKKSSPRKFMFYDHSFPKMIIICTPQIALFYFPADNKDDDKNYVIKGMNMDDIIQRLIMDELSYSETKCSQYNLELWDELIKSLENLINQ